MDQDRVRVEELYVQDIRGFICDSRDVGPFEELCRKQLPVENNDDWSESCHY